MNTPLRSIRSLILLLAGVFTLALITGTANAQGPANGVHSGAANQVNPPHSNDGFVPGAPVQRERQPFGTGEITDEDQRRRRHAEAALRTLLAKREDDIKRRVANGELESAVRESLGDEPTLESIMAQGDTSQEDLLRGDVELDAIGRPLVVIPTPEQVRLAGYAPEAVDRVIQDARDARALQITEADAAKAAADAAEKGPGPAAVTTSGGGPSAASAATFAAAGGADNLSTDAGQKAAADEKASSAAPATGA